MRDKGGSGVVVVSRWCMYYVCIMYILCMYYVCIYFNMCEWKIYPMRERDQQYPSNSGSGSGSGSGVDRYRLDRDADTLGFQSSRWWNIWRLGRWMTESLEMAIGWILWGVCYLRVRDEIEGPIEMVGSSRDAFCSSWDNHREG